MTTVELADLIDDAGDLDLTRVAAAVADGPVEAALVTDEELHWLGPDPDAEPDPATDAPRLGSLSPEAQEGALEASLRLLEARGELERDAEHPGQLLRTGLHAYVVSLRESSVTRTALTYRSRHDATPLRAVAWRLTEGVELLQRTDDAGFHRFTLVSTEALLGWMLGLLGDLATSTGADEPTRAVGPETLDPAIAERLRAAEHRLDVTHTFLTADADERAAVTRSASLIAVDGQATVLRAFSDHDREEQVALDLDLRGLVRWVAAFLSTEPAPGDQPIAPAD